MLSNEKQKLIEKIKNYSSLNFNWDGEGSEKIEQNSILSAINFIELMPNDKPIPEDMAFANGQVGLFWELENLYADLEFYSDHRITYFIEKNKNQKFRGFVLFDQKEFPELFKSLLTI